MFSTEILAAFGSGIFASAFGALPAFIMCGFFVLAGMPDLAFGPYFGPHVAFAGAVAATAYAGRKELLEGNNILAPLIKFNDASVLLVGGVFGVLGLFVNKFLAGMAIPTDTIALTVAISGITARILFGKEPHFGKYTFPEAKTALTFVILGLGVGAVAGYAAILTKNAALPFGVAAVSLLALQFMGEGPVTHHVALPAAVAAVTAGNPWMGAVFGILGVFLGDFFGRTVNCAGKSHIDPPAITIALLTTLALLLLK